ncbi:MAG TPA: phosphatidate cytidylyltransferase [Phycisphaerales bacterium]|nr:phosphatidate cytidylyltransferase [Phycisphaerales bacterium]HMP36566.1 phosphatidate cytidylyltransferase [Phycisphaerales bacterium]
MLAQRLITGPLLIVAIVALFWGDDRLAGAPLPASLAPVFGAAAPPGLLLWAFIVALLAPAATRELVGLLRGQGLAAWWPIHLVGAVAALTAVWMAALHGAEAMAADGGALRSAATAPLFLAIVLVVVVAAAFVAAARGRTIEGATAAVGGALLTTVLLGVLPAFYLALRAERSAWIVLGAILTAKACDIGAYFVGRTIGRNKLIPWLSPGKTWEGVGGGIAFGALVGALLALASGALPEAERVAPALGALAGALFAVVGQAGDLAESLLKRAAGAKDSGRSLPGMGGVLDVIDSAVATAPVAWLLLR